MNKSVDFTSTNQPMQMGISVLTDRRRLYRKLILWSNSWRHSAGPLVNCNSLLVIQSIDLMSSLGLDFKFPVCEEAARMPSSRKLGLVSLQFEVSHNSEQYQMVSLFHTKFTTPSQVHRIVRVPPSSFHSLKFHMNSIPDWVFSPHSFRFMDASIKYWLPFHELDTVWELCFV